MGKFTNIGSDDLSSSAQVLNSGTHARSDMGEVTNISSDDHPSGAQALNSTRWSTRLMKQKDHTLLNAEQDLDVLSTSMKRKAVSEDVDPPNDDFTDLNHVISTSIWEPAILTEFVSIVH